MLPSGLYFTKKTPLIWSLDTTETTLCINLMIKTEGKAMPLDQDKQACQQCST